MRRRFLLAVSLPLCLGVAAMCWFDYHPMVFPESDGLDLRLYREVLPYRYIDAHQYFDALGFKFGKGWMGGMQVGRGQFMYRVWSLIIPYWFCALTAGTLFCLVIARIRRRIRRRRSGR